MSSKTKTTAMKEVARPAFVPKLRFPEFRGADGWTGEKLGSKTKKVGSGITPTGGEKNYKQAGRPFVRSQNIGWGELLLDDVAFIDEETHNSFSSTQINIFDVFLNITGASIGRSAVADARIEGGNVNQHVCIIRIKPGELSPHFLNQYLISLDGQKQIDSFQAGGNRQGLNFEQIRSFLIPLPADFNEQQKIAECLSSVDELMSAKARKVDALMTHKKGLMQQLFPREGEIQPRLRFPEFKGEWNDSTLGDLCFSVSSGKDSRDSDGAFDLYGSTGVIGKTAKASYDTPHILVARVGANAGHLTKASGQFGVTDNTLVIRLTPAARIDYIFHYLGNININKLIFGSGQPLITGSILKAQRVLVPSASEQCKISNCLSSIDDLINAESNMLEALNTHKKGLIQQLFPSADGVKG